MKKSTCGSSSVGLILSIWHNHGSRLSKSFQWSCIGLIGFFIFSLTIEILPGLGKHLILFFFWLFLFYARPVGPIWAPLAAEPITMLQTKFCTKDSFLTPTCQMCKPGIQSSIRLWEILNSSPFTSTAGAVELLLHHCGWWEPSPEGQDLLQGCHAQLCSTILPRWVKHRACASSVD